MGDSSLSNVLVIREFTIGVVTASAERSWSDPDDATDLSERARSAKCRLCIDDCHLWRARCGIRSTSESKARGNLSQLSTEGAAYSDGVSSSHAHGHRYVETKVRVSEVI